MSPPTDLDPLCITEKGAQECQNRVENIALGFSKKSRKNNNNNNTKNNNNGEKIKDCCTIGDRRPPLPEVRGEPAVSGSLGRFERPIWEGACTGVQESQVIEAIYKRTRGGGV